MFECSNERMFECFVGAAALRQTRGAWYNSMWKGDDDMPSVMDYEEVKTSFPRVFDFVSGANGTVVTIVRAGRPVARLSPISVYRTTEADPSLKGKVNCDLFADESADWESV